MILKGNQRASGQELARHLLNVDDNEHALVHELRGFLAEDLFGAFQETEAVSLGTKCQQYLFSLSLNPPQTEKVSVAEFEAVIADIERRLGLTDQPRAIVFHEKKGRPHAHCVWSRIDAAKMRAINLPHFKLRLTDSRDERRASVNSGAVNQAVIERGRDCRRDPRDRVICSKMPLDIHALVQDADNFESIVRASVEDQMRPNRVLEISRPDMVTRT